MAVLTKTSPNGLHIGNPLDVWSRVALLHAWRRVRCDVAAAANGNFTFRTLLRILSTAEVAEPDPHLRNPASGNRRLLSRNPKTRSQDDRAARLFLIGDVITKTIPGAAREWRRMLLLHKAASEESV